MNKSDIVKISRFLSLVLRHKPEKIGLHLDEQGWASVPELLTKMRVHRKFVDKDLLIEVVEKNDKKRFVFSEDQQRIRASQGHSISIDLAYKATEPPVILYHGTATRFLKSILETGLKKRSRHHVHLSPNKETALQVGQRHGKPVILEVLAQKMQEAGFEFFVSDNGVWLTDQVPVEYLVVNDFSL